MAARTIDESVQDAENRIQTLERHLPNDERAFIAQALRVICEQRPNIQGLAYLRRTRDPAPFNKTPILSVLNNVGFPTSVYGRYWHETAEVNGTTLSPGTPIMISDPARFPHAPQVLAEQSKGQQACIFPIRRYNPRARVEEPCVLLYTETALSFSEDDIKFLQAMSDLLHSIHEYRDNFVIDKLTGFVHRNIFDAALDTAIQRVRQEGNALTLMLGDYNNLSVYNDKAGHAAGDQFLRMTSLQILLAVRETDIVGRLGGDEFGIILEGAPSDVAARVRQEIYSTADRCIQEAPPRPDVELPCDHVLSIGYDEYHAAKAQHGHDLTMHGFKDHVDRHLYKEKRRIKRECGIALLGKGRIPQGLGMLYDAWRTKKE